MKTRQRIEHATGVRYGTSGSSTEDLLLRWRKRFARERSPWRAALQKEWFSVQLYNTSDISFISRIPVYPSQDSSEPHWLIWLSPATNSLRFRIFLWEQRWGRRGRRGTESETPIIAKLGTRTIGEYSLNWRRKLVPCCGTIRLEPLGEFLSGWANHLLNTTWCRLTKVCIGSDLMFESSIL